MKKISLDTSYVGDFISAQDYEIITQEVEDCHKLLVSQTGPGSQYLGWLDLPNTNRVEEIEQITQVAKQIRSQSDVVIVIGIGGSYLGARSAIEALRHSFYNQIASARNLPEIYFAGINLSSKYIAHLLTLIEGRDFSLIVISKSGTTLEPAIAFRILRDELEKRYGIAGSVKRIAVITDRDKGALKTLALERGYKSFIVPENVGGRYSVLTPVGLLPIAVAGIDIKSLLEGANEAYDDFLKSFPDNICLHYAAVRNILYRKGYIVEMLISYEPSLISFAEWWKQLFGESEGKEGKGIFPASASFTMDLHSMGQYIQEGTRNLFETLLSVEDDAFPIIITKDENNLDGLNYIAGKSLHHVNQKASEGTIEAHVSGGVPNIILRIQKLDSFQLGYMYYFFEKACAISGYLLGVNPFNQPGVEAYKKNMFRLLGKPGFGN